MQFDEWNHRNAVPGKYRIPTLMWLPKDFPNHTFEGVRTFFRVRVTAADVRLLMGLPPLNTNPFIRAASIPDVLYFLHHHMKYETFVISIISVRSLVTFRWCLQV